MLTLRLTQTKEETGKFRLETALEGEGIPRQTATARFNFELTAQDQESIRWYLEDYLQYPQEPAPTIAARVERRMAEIGADLFKALFHSSDDARDLWAALRNRLNDTRVEIITSVEEAASIPWELVRDPKTDVPLALRAQSFVRAHPQTAQKPYVPQTESGPIRILLVICRPSGRRDVPFRSVAGRLIKGLSEDARKLFQLDVLRPATFERLSQALGRAREEGKSYHIVHFDGHGAYLDMEKLFKGLKDKTDEEMTRRLAELLHIDRDRFSPQAMYPRPVRGGEHGYVVFENPELPFNTRIVDAAELSSLLVENQVPVLALNACRSAYAAPRTSPDTPVPDDVEDPHRRLRALGTLAQEVMDAGVAGVVAMRYSVYVVTAADFVANLYASLARGQTLGEAVTIGRKQLAAKPLREITFDPRPLQDWCVPLAYEVNPPITLFPRAPEEAEKLQITIAGPGAALTRGEGGQVDQSLPRPPDVGFFGRDETLLALDRAFDTESIVLLHAFAGSGKTATSAEFARWYAMTGGLDGGAVLFTKFEHYTPLRTVLGHLGEVFAPTLEQSGLNWSAITETEQMREVALQVLRQIPVLWIWDNVEPITGFPKGTESAWSEDEQKELVDFLRDAKESKARFLLTSRREETDWLGDLPRRIIIPPMPMMERVQLARALAERAGSKLTDVEDWRPLLDFTQGNPLTITVLVGQALRDGLRTKRQIGDFVEKLRAGEAAFEDEASEGRSKSLGASLSYGFENAFTEDERKQLALLHLFQGFVDVDVLKVMGLAELGPRVPKVHGLTREAGIRLLDGAAEVGLLTAHCRGFYTVHPALPWFFRSLFDKYCPEHPDAHSAAPGRRLVATRAFVQAISGLADHCFWQYERGKRDAIDALAHEEANLLHARRLSRAHGWWEAVVSTMQGLRVLYDHTGRRAEWKRLVEDIVPEFVDPTTDGPLRGREEAWGLVTDYRVHLAEQDRRWSDAKRLQLLVVERDRERAGPALAKPSEELGDEDRGVIRRLAATLSNLAAIQHAQGLAGCAALYQEAAALAEPIGERGVVATCALNLGHAYIEIPELRDLGKAEQFYRRSLQLRDERDRLGKARCLNELGIVAYLRFREALGSQNAKAQMRRHLEEAFGLCAQALSLLPQDAPGDLAPVHQQLGTLYAEARDVDGAICHYRESVRYLEEVGDLYRAAEARYNIACLLFKAARFADALEYATAALRNYETYANRAPDRVQQMQQLIAAIEKALARQKGES